MSDEPQPYVLVISSEAEKQLKKLDKTVILQINKKLLYVASNAEQIEHVELSGNWAGHHRVRVGDYRVIYTMNKEKREIVIVAIGHRRDVYDE